MTEDKSQGKQPWWHESNADTEGENPAGVGTAAQEAVRLAAAVTDWATRTGLTDTFRGIAEQTAEGVRAAAMKAAQASNRGAADESDVDDADGLEEDADLEAEVAYEDAEYEAGEYEDAADEEAADEAPLHGDSVCEYCPVCQGMTLLRSVSPEAADGMAEALSAVTVAVRQAVDGFAQQSSGGSKVEHIDIE